jgi:hypothetical protein
MLKSIIIASALTVSAPALAQVMQPSAAVPADTQQGATNADPSQATPMAQPPAGTESAPAQTAEAQPATGAQIADVVGTEFPTYDKNGDGSLSATEFSAWMVALKTASDPSTKATAPATKTWVATAFAQADADKNKKVSKGELTTFLSAAG